MLCDKCSNVVFRHRPNDSRNVYYNHHKNQQDLEASKSLCHLCWKVWHALKTEFEKNRGWTGSVFEDSEPAKIEFSIMLRADHPLDDSLTRLLDDELFRVQCGKLSVYSSFSKSLSGKFQAPRVMVMATACV
jgi:hypothetical protein